LSVANLFGITPRSPRTGYGCLEAGEPLSSQDDTDAFRVWKASGLIALLREYLPDIAAGVEDIASHCDDPARLRAARFRADLAAGFPELSRPSVDYGLLDSARDVVVVRATFRWYDVGSWTAASAYLRAGGLGDRLEGRHLGVDTSNRVVVAGKRSIATVGPRNVVVVQTDNAVLVGPRDAVEEVKRVVDELEARGEHDLL
jgi:mannose-1-phosphate guanylyltransferase